jgi:hypothetical protein
MTPKENTLRLIHFDRPERIVPAPHMFTLSYLGCHHEGFDGRGSHCSVGTRWVDIWGTGWHKALDGIMGYPQDYPLSEVGALRLYRWPDSADERIFSRIYKQKDALPDEDRLLAGQHRCTLWERAYKLTGRSSGASWIFSWALPSII